VVELGLLYLAITVACINFVLTGQKLLSDTALVSIVGMRLLTGIVFPAFVFRRRVSIKDEMAECSKSLEIVAGDSVRDRNLLKTNSPYIERRKFVRTLLIPSRNQQLQMSDNCAPFDYIGPTILLLLIGWTGFNGTTVRFAIDGTGVPPFNGLQPPNSLLLSV